MRRSDWQRIIQRAYRARPMTLLDHPCMVSLLGIQRVTEPLTVHSLGFPVTIAAPGYSWLQVAQEGRPVWLTAMYDTSGRLLQMYFDITAGNRFDGTDNPRFRDMYLDVVMLPDTSLRILDEDELDEALQSGDITAEEHACACRNCKELCAWLREHGQELMEACDAARRELAD